MNKKLVLVFMPLLLLNSRQCEARRWWERLLVVPEVYDLATQPHHHGHNRPAQPKEQQQLHKEEPQQPQPQQLPQIQQQPQDNAKDQSFGEQYKGELKKEGASFLAKATVAVVAAGAIAAAGYCAGKTWSTPAQGQAPLAAQPAAAQAAAAVPAAPQPQVIFVPQYADYSDDEDQSYYRQHNHKHKHHSYAHY